jgi:hypothetical protein
MLDIERIISIYRGFEYAVDTGIRRCPVCGDRFEDGVVYRIGDSMYEARKAAEIHANTAHGDRLERLIANGKEFHGLSEIQGEILLGLYRGTDDRELARQIGGRSLSTVRNHRFQLQKRRREAEALLALMALADEGDGAGRGGFLEFHADLPVQDDRVVISLKEAREIEEKHLDLSAGVRILKFPKKEKAKLVILRRLAELFQTGRRYREPEVNELLKACADDYVTVRRYLIEYRFLKRSPGGAEYWRD